MTARASIAAATATGFEDDFVAVEEAR